METIVVVALVALSVIWVIWRILRKMGVTPSGKPDCGCGHCHEKRRRPNPSR